MPTDGTLLDVVLRVDYPNKPQALRNVAFSMQQGEVLGLVGESGSGKSTIALALLGLSEWKEGRASGRVVFRGRDLLTASEREMQRVRGREIGLVLQSPTASLNPALCIGRQLGEAWRAHARGSVRERDEAVGRALARVGLPQSEEFRRRYPSQISVGQAQRVLIGMALMHSPALLIADEPTSALDAATQLEVLNMLAKLNRDTGTGVLYISHDLQSVASLCQRVAILHEGEIVECGRTQAVLRKPRHTYTQRLLACAPWLQWWAEQVRPERPASAGDSTEACAPAVVRATQVQVLWGLKSPSLSPMG